MTTDQQVRLVMVPGLKWPTGDEWQLPPDVAAGSVVTGSQDALGTARTGKNNPQPNDQALLDVEILSAEAFATSGSVMAKPGESVFVAGYAESGMPSAERPLLMLGTDRPGLLTSDSTKRPGLVDLRDLSALVSGESEGAPLRVDVGTVPDPSVLGTRAQLTGFYDDNNPVFIVLYVSFIVLIALLAAWTRWWGGPVAIRNGALAIAAVPPAAMFLRWWTATADFGVLGWSALLAGIVGIIVVMAGRRARDAWAPLRRIALLTVVVMVADVLTGAHLQQSGLFGSSPSLGARYYGLGNPATTLLILATIVWSALHLRNLPRPRSGRPAFLQAVVWAIVTLVVGLPGLGADAGGLLVSAAVGLVLVALSAGLKPTKVRIAVLGLAAVIITAGAGVFDALRPEGRRTHLGNLVSDISDQGLAPLGEFVTGRVEANLLGYGFPFSLVVPLATVAALVVLWRAGKKSSLLATGTCEHAAAVGCLIASIGLWAVNDSGVVVLALAAVFVVPLVVASFVKAEDAALLEVKVQ